MTKRPSDLTGERGLLLAVIDTAVKDATGRNKEQRADAWRYFASGVYEQHLTCLDLPTEYLPEVIENEAQRVCTIALPTNQ